MKKSLRERQLNALFAEQSGLQAEVARMRPVFRAAMRWNKVWGRPGMLAHEEAQLYRACASAARKGKAK